MQIHLLMNNCRTGAALADNEWYVSSSSDWLRMEGKFIAVYRRNRSEAPSSGCSPEEEQMAQFRIHHTRPHRFRLSSTTESTEQETIHYYYYYCNSAQFSNAIICIQTFFYDVNEAINTDLSSGRMKVFVRLRHVHEDGMAALHQVILKCSRVQ